MMGWGSEERTYEMDTPEFDVKKVEKRLIKELQKNKIRAEDGEAVGSGGVGE